MAPDKKKKSINLPDEIIFDILLCLPIKSLMRFRCVNKTWLQLLTNDPQFAPLYVHQVTSKSNKNNNNSPSLLAFRKETLKDQTHICSAVELTACDKVVNLELPFCRGTTNPSYVLHTICNGLLLVSLADEKEKKKLLIWNPFTNDYIHIPYPPPIPKHNKCSASGNKIRNCFGFCFHEGINQYKVIWFSDCELIIPFHNRLHVSVYTLGTDSSSWRNLKDIEYKSVRTNCAPALVNGALHWIAFIGFLRHSPRILSFDMKDEAFKEIPLPHQIPNGTSKYFSRVGELGGLLCILLGTQHGDNFDIFVMQQYGVANSWIKHCTIVRREILGSFLFLRTLSFTQNREILLITVAGELILYNLETNSFKLAGFGHHFYNAYTYRPSFISPRAICGGSPIM
ncbi:hypothetical protein AQUCO_02600240v1 [Aquilegia coerulea]|uniref:F-box domain-containing protein n=1 Tax=Aquilegia coerulea TaxID=218851 RepID=A0A2G5D804_AQUCA|nr:hypothetical protein AQUCO_02600240v1 [Aquilegia coerulea]